MMGSERSERIERVERVMGRDRRDRIERSGTERVVARAASVMNGVTVRSWSENERSGREAKE